MTLVAELEAERGEKPRTGVAEKNTPFWWKEAPVMSQASQEHGILAMRAGSGKSMPELPVGTRIRSLPNHACAMAAQHDF